MSQEISTKEVKKHKGRKSTWIILHNEVYDVTSFLSEHPGGEDSILDVAGKDGTLAFEDVGHSEDARQMLKKYKIGKLPLDEHSKTVAPCCKTSKAKKSDGASCTEESCVAGKQKLSKNDKTWRTYDGSSSTSRPVHKTTYKKPPEPRPERRIQNIIVPRERTRRRVRPPSPPPQSSNLKWAILALAGAIIIGLVLKKYMG